MTNYYIECTYVINILDETSSKEEVTTQMKEEVTTQIKKTTHGNNYSTMVPRVIILYSIVTLLTFTIENVNNDK